MGDTLTIRRVDYRISDLARCNAVTLSDVTINVGRITVH